MGFSTPLEFLHDRFIIRSCPISTLVHNDTHFATEPHEGSVQTWADSATLTRSPGESTSEVF